MTRDQKSKIFSIGLVGVICFGTALWINWKSGVLMFIFAWFQNWSNSLVREYTMKGTPNEQKPYSSQSICWSRRR